MTWIRLVLLCFTALSAFAQQARLIPVDTMTYPGRIDGNSPSFWHNGRLRMFTSIGQPLMINDADSWFGAWSFQPVDVTAHSHIPVWVEAAWVDADGTIFGWYHHEPGGVCPGTTLSTPKIGAIVSYDGGLTVQDLGIVLESGDPVNCGVKNGFFAGGHGDFSVIPDRENGYLYFFFTNYGGSASTHGVSVARLAMDDRFDPVGRVAKYYQGDWTEPGVGGRVTPIYPATKGWEVADTDSFWGPSVHWNTGLQQYVMVMNRSCCRPNWPMEGVYISYGLDLANPATWGRAEKLLDGREASGYYPQVVGMANGETDSLVGAKARLFVQGVSHWEIVFPTLGDDPSNPSQDDPLQPLPTEP
jgi:hypothetical protein